MDALGSLLNEVRSGGAVFGRTIVDSPWAVRFADATPLTLITMVRGSGWLLVDGAEPVRLQARDVAIVTGGPSFTISDDVTGATTPYFIAETADSCRTAVGEPFGPEHWLGARTCGESLDSPHVLLTAGYQVRGRVSERLLSALPTTVVVPDHDGPCPILDLVIDEIDRSDPGQQVVLDRLLDLLVLTTLRDWFQRPEAEPPPWYRALGDPVAGPALRAIHDDPARPWTVASLAAEARVSRATFARRFADLVGESPKAYLGSWRLCLAADLLGTTDATVEAVARRVGYANAYALSAAFTRRYGARPGEYRRAAAAA